MAIDSDSARRIVEELREVFHGDLTRSVEWRATQLQGIVKLCEERESELLNAIAEDLHKSRCEAWTSEIACISNSASHSLRNLKNWIRPQKVSTNLVNIPGSSQIVPEPYGVTLIISPWNYPFMLAMEPLIGAIAAGNVVVLKPSEVAPSTSSLLSRILPLYLDPKAIRVVEGNADVAAALLEQRFDKIFFTGSTAVGRIVATAAAKHLTPVTLELGGKNPVIVDSTVDLNIAARRIVYGKFINNGQACLAPDYVLVEHQIASKLINAIITCIKEFYGSDPVSSPDLSRIVNQRHFQRLLSLLSNPDISTKVVHGGKHVEEKLFIHPTVLRDVPWDSPIMQEEIFGPILIVQSIENVQEAISIVREKEKPLALYIFSNHEPTKDIILHQTSCGGVCINDTVMHFTNYALPFGGVGASGNGRYHGKFSFDCFSHMKSVLHKSLAAPDIPQRFPPFTRSKELVLRALLTADFLGLILVLLGFKR